MKLNIVQTKENEEDTTFDELQNIVNGAYEDINIDTSLDCVPFASRQDYLKQIIDKLKFNGYITISGTDITECNSALESGEFTIEQYNKLVFKNGQKSLSNIVSVIEILQTYGLSIESKTFSQPTKYYVRAKRPE